MSPISKTSLHHWQAEQSKDAGFVEATDELELAYQVAWLRMGRGWSQAQLAEKVGVRKSIIVRIEYGTLIPNWFLMSRIALVLNTRIEIKFISCR
jgi:DNA-binding XRE family transcriptional regulator